MLWPCTACDVACVMTNGLRCILLHIHYRCHVNLDVGSCRDGFAAGSRASWQTTRIANFHVGSCREGGHRGSDNNEGDHEHQQPLLEDGNDEGEGEGSSSHAHGKTKKENKGDKRESEVGAV